MYNTIIQKWGIYMTYKIHLVYEDLVIKHFHS